MAFNFGAEPFKFPLPQGYVPIKSAPSEKAVVNSNSGDGGGESTVKIINNAPQAIIIEVHTFVNLGNIFFAYRL
jgi:ATP-dependent RNA helicase DDX1